MDLDNLPAHYSSLATGQSANGAPTTRAESAFAYKVDATKATATTATTTTTTRNTSSSNDFSKLSSDNLPNSLDFPILKKAYMLPSATATTETAPLIRSLLHHSGSPNLDPKLATDNWPHRVEASSSGTFGATCKRHDHLASVDNLPPFLLAATDCEMTQTIATTTTTATPTTTLVGESLPRGSTLQGWQLRGGTSLGLNLMQQYLEDLRRIEDTVDSIELPARGRCKVFMAKYDYDPVKQSPNGEDVREAELTFQAGDYVLVFEDPDEDGYFVGELLDGRRGYVPSNWLNRLTGEDLFEFQATTLYSNKHTSMASTSGFTRLEATNTGQSPTLNGQRRGELTMTFGNSCPEFYEFLADEPPGVSPRSWGAANTLAPEDYHRMNDYVDLEDVDEVDDECLSDYERAEAEQSRRAVPPPQRLVLERQLNKCILIAWLHPQSAKGTIVSYQVYVDGVLKSTVPSGDRTKALLEGVDSSLAHRISVRAIDLHGRHSNDAGCTIVIGQRIPFAPSCVKASHITSDSALISWLPANSNFHHVVAVNSVEVQTVRPGVYKHLINGLSANTLYRVWVRAKPRGKTLCHLDEKNAKKLDSLTTCVDFKTMPKSLPDPPVNVQVEAGPQRQTLLVTWLPLTLNDFGSSNGCAVTGYAVFAGHKKLADIDSPTGDHALLELSDLESLHRKSVTVRTKSGENLSQDSMACKIPDEYLKRSDLSSLQRSYHQQNISHYGSTGHQSPLRKQQRPLVATSLQRRRHHSNHQQQQQRQSRYHTSDSNGAQLVARSSLQAGLVDSSSQVEHSRRSSVPSGSLEATGGEAATRSNSDAMLPTMMTITMMNPTESYSEEEFESSMLRARAGRKGHARIDGHKRAHTHRATNRARGTPSEHLVGGGCGGDDDGVQYFVALFDYDPATMSPNPNAAADELAFKEGTIIKVHGRLGEDGFYRGQVDNRFGYVPSNVVTRLTEPSLLAGSSREISQQVVNAPASQQAGRVAVDDTKMMQQSAANQQQQRQQQQQGGGGGVKRMVALYDYDPQENSPNADTESEIPFKVGDLIHVYGKMDTDGFYLGEVERTKQRGLVPSNFLREDPPPTAMVSGQLSDQHHPGLNQQYMGTNPVQVQPQQQVPLGVGLNLVRVGSESQQPQAREQGGNQAANNIHRPTSLSLNYQQQQQHHKLAPGGPGANTMSQCNSFQVPQQQQQQQQSFQNVNMASTGGQLNAGLPAHQQHQMDNNLLQHQQGVMSNLLSSGKQMVIGGAQLPNASVQQQQQQQQQQQMSNQMRDQSTALIFGGGGHQTMAIAHNSFTMANNLGNNGGNHSAMIAGQQLTSQRPAYGSQHHLGGRLSRPPVGESAGPTTGLTGQSDADQGGNILNTVKNMFKL